MDIIFRDNNVELSIGDSIVLRAPANDESFFSSRIGEKFEEGVLDELVIEIRQREWLEVWLYATATLNGVAVTEEEFYNDAGFGTEDWSENVDYTFMRYLLNKGAIKR